MSTTNPPKVPRAQVRLAEDNHEKLRQQAFYQKTTITKLVNDLLRYSIPLAEAGIFNRPINDILRALDTLAKEGTPNE